MDVKVSTFFTRLYKTNQEVVRIEIYAADALNNYSVLVTISQ